MKAYKRMRDGENLSWCRPYRCGDNYYVRNESGVIGIMQNGKDLIIDKDTLHIVNDCDDWEEIGCAECPWRDECEAMDVDTDEFSDDELAEIVRDAYDWTESDCQEAMTELCNRAGYKLRVMVRDGVDCSELFQNLRRCTSEEFLSGTPDASDDQEDLTDWLIYGAEQADAVNLAYCLQTILDVDLGL